MKLRFVSSITASAVSAALLLAGLLGAQQPAKMKRTADGHPDLGGIWAYAVDLPAGGIKRVSNGQVTVTEADLSNRRAPKGEVKGGLHSHRLRL